MMSVSELEALIARTPDGEPVVLKRENLGSAAHVMRKLNEVKMARTDDRNFVMYIGLNEHGECCLIPFSTIGDADDFRRRHPN